MSRLAWFGGVFVFVLGALAACSSSETPARDDGSSGSPDKDSGLQRGDGSVADSTPSPESGLGELLFRPNKVYTGVDGTHTFKVPVAVYDFDSDLTVTANDPSAVTIAKTSLKNPVSPDGVVDNGQYFMLTALKAGSYTLTATSKGRTTTASFTVTSYASDRWQSGKDRYDNGVVTKTADRACTTCHAGAGAIDHSPAALAYATDQDVGVIITTGVKPGPNGTTSVIKITSEPGTQHKWTVTDPEKEGLITFLRALEPNGFQ
jgi:hypothetical protein